MAASLCSHILCLYILKFHTPLEASKWGLTGHKTTGHNYICVDSRRSEALKLRVIEHNVMVAARYYSEITTQRLSQLLDLSLDDVSCTDGSVSSGFMLGKLPGDCKERVGGLDGACSILFSEFTFSCASICLNLFLPFLHVHFRVVLCCCLQLRPEAVRQAPRTQELL
eukprot:1148494-Pelagomonas_calceolata.AAC.2